MIPPVRTAKIFFPSFQIATRRMHLFSSIFSLQRNWKITPLKDRISLYRGIGGWPIIPITPRQRISSKYHLTPNKQFVLENLNFSEGKEKEMSEILQFLKTTDFEWIQIQRGSIISDSEWVADLLTHIAKGGARQLQVIARSDQFRNPESVELVQPSPKELRTKASCLQKREERPQEMKICIAHLSNTMIRVLSEIMSQSSHGVAFDLIIKKNNG